jgi:hypothetical protein
VSDVSSADVFKVKRRLFARIAAWFAALRVEVAARTGGGPGGTLRSGTTSVGTPGAWPAFATSSTSTSSGSFATHQDKLRIASYMILLRDVFCHLCDDLFCHPVLTSLVDDDMWSLLTPALLRMFISFSASQVRV